jgi:hypothetical protein
MHFDPATARLREGDQVGAHGMDRPTRGDRPLDHRLDQPGRSLRGRDPRSDDIARNQRPPTVGERLETLLDLQRQAGVEDRLAGSVVSQRRARQGTEEGGEHVDRPAGRYARNDVP